MSHVFIFLITSLLIATPLPPTTAVHLPHLTHADTGGFPAGGAPRGDVTIPGTVRGPIDIEFPLLTNDAWINSGKEWAQDEITQLDSDQALRAASSFHRLAPQLAQVHRNLELARTLLAILQSHPTGDAETAITLAKIATRHQAATLGLTWIEPTRSAAHESPSEALLELASRRGVSPTPTQLERTRDLDTLPEPLRSSLTQVVDAFLDLDTATHNAFANADPDQLHALEILLHATDPLAPMGLASSASFAPGKPLFEAGVDLTPIFPARNALLDAISELRTAINTTTFPLHSPVPPFEVCPAYSIDLSQAATGIPHDDIYTQDCALVIDTGGNDIYHNNAGGGSSLQLTPTAALIDLAGNDKYGDPAAPRSQGVNGGGSLGTGFLFDEAGLDIYIAGVSGVNGGGLGGVGFLLDAGEGNDEYRALQAIYDICMCGGNGGGGIGSGFLLDAGGSDTYSAGDNSGNGGGDIGVGFLLDGDGDDTYQAADSATNGGGGTLGGVGFLLDADGNDRYAATFGGTNGGGNGGVGFLLDANGDDTYTASDLGANGGGNRGVGFLLDAAGTDTYSDTEATCNGSGTDRTEFPKCSSGAQIDLVPECMDTVDDDGNGDPPIGGWPGDANCDIPWDDDETGGPRACWDGVDNDNDGRVDFPRDTGCSSVYDDNEDGRIV